MRITKVIRDYMEEVLTKKRLEANSKERAGYAARAKECEEELQKLLDTIHDEASRILKKYGMSERTLVCGRETDAFKAIFDFKPLYIKNIEEEKSFNDHAAGRYAAQKEEMKRIELEAALGADKDAFMAMLEEVTFE